MTRKQKAVAVAVIHVLIVCSLGAKLLYDRATRPRVWAPTMSYDPNLPIRGRYVSLRVQVETDAVPPVAVERTGRYGYARVGLSERNGHLLATSDHGNEFMNWMLDRRGRTVAVLAEPVLFFIPDTAQDPSRVKPGEQLWVEVTIPKKGPPRPLQLAVSRVDGKFEVLRVQ